MNFSAWSIRSPIPSLLLFIILMAGGLYCFRGLPIQNFPDIDLPTVTVTTTLKGATPSQMETEVTRKIEDSVATIGAVEHITSTITDGSSVTTVQFVLEKNTQEATDDVRDAVSRIRSQLPSNVDDPIIARVNVSGNALLTYAVEASNMDEEELSWFVDNTVSKGLLAVNGVGKITRQGGVDREIRLELEPSRLRAYGITTSDISSRLRNTQEDTSGGRTTVGGSEQALRSVGTIKSADDLAGFDISLSDGRRVALGDLGKVRDTAAERRQMALLNGKRVVSFQVFRSTGTSEVTVAKQVRAAVQKLASDNAGLKITEVSNNVASVQLQYDSSMHALYEGALLAIIVVFLFLRDLRATLVSAVALPLSIIPTFWAMSTLGFTLNTVTLLSLTLVVGILVDDAIVEVENIVRHLQMGKSPMQAALEAADEIGLAVIATSLTLVAVFLPTAFMSGIPGKFFKQFGWTASLAVLASLLVARLLTPMMAAYILKPSAHVTEDGPFMQRYLRAVRWCLIHPFATSAMAGVFFILSVMLATQLSATFIPSQDLGQITVKVEATPGTLIDQTAALAEAVRQQSAAVKEVSSVYAAIGSGSQIGFGASSSGEVRSATLTLTLSKPRSRSQQQIEAELRQRFADIPGARISIGAGASGEVLALVIASDDATLLSNTAQAVARDMRTLRGFGNVTSSASLLRPEVLIRPDLARAADLGVTTQAIGDAVRVATSGDFDVNLAKLNLPARQIPVRVQLDPNTRDNLDTLAQLPVVSKNGTVPLGQVASLAIDSGPAQINRYDRSRNVTVSIELGGRPLGDATKLVNVLPSVRQLPPGVHRLTSGDAERQKELFNGFILAMLAGVFCVYAVLILLFHNFLQPVTILAALPLAVGGAFGALWLFGFSLSMASLIGLLMLMGVVTKNSILLVEYAIVAQRERGLSRTDAMMDACHKRARPILMTTIAMIAGMLPMALGIEGDPSFRAPMAVAVIGGLITSTLLSLLVVPVVFELVDGFKTRLASLFMRKGGAVVMGGSAGTPGKPSHV